MDVHVRAQDVGDGAEVWMRAQEGEGEEVRTVRFADLVYRWPRFACYLFLLFACFVGFVGWPAHNVPT